MEEPAYFATPDGRMIAHRFAAGTEPALVFLPGYMSDMSGSKATALFDWARAQGRACLLLDYSGCGASSGKFEAGTLSRWADEVVVLIDATRIGSVVLVGSSMGGWIALETCVRSTQNIARLALLAPVGVKFGGREDRDFADIYALPAQDGTRLLFHDPDKYLPDYTSLSDDAALEIARDRQSAGFFLWKPFMHGPALRKWLHRIQVPTLVISGAQDGFVVRGHAAKLAEALPNGRTQAIANAGHYPQIEQAGETAAAIVAFAQR